MTIEVNSTRTIQLRIKADQEAIEKAVYEALVKEAQKKGFVPEEISMHSDFTFFTDRGCSAELVLERNEDG